MSSPQDRDRAVETLLRRSLRQDAGRVPTSACLDAETLAAWVDGGLDEAARRMAEAHASSCARCMALASSMMATEEAPSISSPDPAGWRRWLTMRWLVPVTAAATAFAIWSVVPSQQRPPTSEIADAVKPASGAAPALPAEPSTAPTPSVPAAGDRPALEQDAKRERAAQSAPLSQSAAETPPKQPSAEALTEDTSRQDRRAGLEKSADAPTRAKAAEESPRTAANAPPVPPASPAPAEAPPPAALQEAAGFARAAPSEIATPDPAVRWRTTGTRIEHTVDAGATWSMQQDDAGDALTSGSAPSTTVCWIVGRRGTVLRTIDGRTWARIAFPEAVDLVRVRAIDARTATVTTADDRVFRTADGGATWSP